MPLIGSNAAISLVCDGGIAALLAYFAGRRVDDSLARIDAASGHFPLNAIDDIAIGFDKQNTAVSILHERRHSLLVKVQDMMRLDDTPARKAHTIHDRARPMNFRKSPAVPDARVFVLSSHNSSNSARRFCQIALPACHLR